MADVCCCLVRYVLAGAARQRVSDAVLQKVHAEGIFAEDELEYDIYPLGMCVVGSVQLCRSPPAAML